MRRHTRIGDLTEAEGRERQALMEELREAAQASIILGEFIRVTGDVYSNDDPEDAPHRARVRRESRRLMRGSRFETLDSREYVPDASPIRSISR